jgi:hypothetical protein
MKSYEVVGLRIEKYVGTAVYGHNCDFTYSPEIQQRHVLLLKHFSTEYELTLQTDESECGSGWCTASYGRFDFKQVANFAGKTHRILKGTILNLQVCTQTESLDYVDNSLFSFSEDGGDNYYPSGGYDINMSLFEEIPMTNIKRPVHIFIGDSNSCKSTIAALTGKNILETDFTGVNDLPEIITEDIIVVGNKFNINIETDIIPRIFDLENSQVVVVNFKII